MATESSLDCICWVSDEEKIKNFWIKAAYANTSDKNAWVYEEDLFYKVIEFLNDNKIEGLDEEKLFEELDKDNLTVKFVGSDKEYSLQRDLYKVVNLGIETEFYQVYDINPKKEYFKSHFLFEYWFLDDRFLESARKTFKEILNKDPDAFAHNSLAPGFGYRFDEGSRS